MRLLKLGKNGWIYLLNMTLLVISYFAVRIMPLPLVLNLYASTKDGSMVEGSLYGSTICALQTFLIIPNQCKLGVVVFYTLQMYWFFNITRNWIRAITSKVDTLFPHISTILVLILNETPGMAMLTEWQRSHHDCQVQLINIIPMVITNIKLD